MARARRARTAAAPRASGRSAPRLRPSGRTASPSALTHLDSAGAARMVDVGAKPVTARRATARARVRLSPAALAAVRGGELAKGDALAVARLAGIQAAKRTAEWIPLCHSLPLDHVGITIELENGSRTKSPALTIVATVRAQARTGVEMEALVAVSAAALALYDMLKALDRAIVIEEVLVVEKQGGKSGTFRHPALAREADR